MWEKITNLEWATFYASIDWKVIPLHWPEGEKCSCNRDGCSSPGKHPLTSNGLKDGTTDPAVINAWFTKWPKANIGILTGTVSGLTVLDIDHPKGGISSLEALKTKFSQELPGTLAVKTGGPGEHIYFKTPPEGIKSSAGKLGKGIDVRGEGGYVVAPPSMHISGDLYEWEKDPSITDLVIFPQWLIEALNTLPDKQRTLTPGNISNPRGWVSDCLSDLEPGNRNDSFCKIIGKLISSGWSEEEAYSLLEPHAIQSGFSLDELYEEVSGLYRRYPVLTNFNAMQRSPHLPIIYNSEDVEKIQVREFHGAPMPIPQEDIVEGLVPKGFPTILYGEGGQGKSYIGLFLATCVALGIPFAGLNTKKEKVLFADWELDFNVQLIRAKKIAKGLGLDEPPSGLGHARLEQPLINAIGQLKDLIAQKGYGLIILDSFGAACGIDPDQAKHVNPLFAAIRSLNVSVVILDHQSKMQFGQKYENKTPFGSVYKFNQARSVIQCQKVSNQPGELAILLRQNKNNFSYLSQNIPLKINFEKDLVKLIKSNLVNDQTFLDHLPAEDKIKKFLSEEGSSTTKDISIGTGIPEGTVTNNLTRLKANGLIRVIAKEKHAPIYDLIQNVFPVSNSVENQEENLIY